MALVTALVPAPRPRRASGLTLVEAVLVVVGVAFAAGVVAVASLAVGDRVASHRAAADLDTATVAQRSFEERWLRLTSHPDDLHATAALDRSVAVVAPDEQPDDGEIGVARAASGDVVVVAYGGDDCHARGLRPAVAGGGDADLSGGVVAEPPAECTAAAWLDAWIGEPAEPVATQRE